MENKFNIEALSDRDLTPVDKVVYVGLASKTNASGKSTLTDNQLRSMLQVNRGTDVAQLSEERIEEALQKLIDKGYIDRDLGINLSGGKAGAYDKAVDYVMEYVSKSRIVRGYSKRQLKGEAHRKSILIRLQDGATVDDCIAVINYRFESDWHKKNNKWLIPTTLFRKSKFEEVLSTVPDVAQWANYTITEYGYTSNEDKEERMGTM